MAYFLFIDLKSIQLYVGKFCNGDFHNLCQGLAQQASYTCVITLVNENAISTSKPLYKCRILLFKRLSFSGYNFAKEPHNGLLKKV